MPTVKMQTNYGTVLIQLNSEKAPKTVANFLSYVNSGFYTGTLFHRVIENFMIQGGGMTRGMQPKATQPPIPNEANNELKNEEGSIAMARTSDPHSASSQFFINVADNDFLNYRAPTPDGWGYCVFGKVIEGIDVVNKIKQVATTSKGFHKDVPQQEVIIESVEEITMP